MANAIHLGDATGKPCPESLEFRDNDIYSAFPAKGKQKTLE